MLRMEVIFNSKCLRIITQDLKLQRHLPARCQRRDLHLNLEAHHSRIRMHWAYRWLVSYLLVNKLYQRQRRKRLCYLAYLRPRLQARLTGSILQLIIETSMYQHSTVINQRESWIPRDHQVPWATEATNQIGHWTQQPREALELLIEVCQWTSQQIIWLRPRKESSLIKDHVSLLITILIWLAHRICISLQNTWRMLWIYLLISLLETPLVLASLVRPTNS